MRKNRESLKINVTRYRFLVHMIRKSFKVLKFDIFMSIGQIFIISSIIIHQVYGAHYFNKHILRNNIKCSIINTDVKISTNIKISKLLRRKINTASY